jgi:hypothetical protein
MARTHWVDRLRLERIVGMRGDALKTRTTKSSNRRMNPALARRTAPPPRAGAMPMMHCNAFIIERSAAIRSDADGAARDVRHGARPASFGSE